MTRYSSGRAFEWRVLHALEDAGWIPMRSAGSHGIADLVAFCDHRVAVIQCKTDGALYGEQYNALASLAGPARVIPVLAQSAKEGRRSIIQAWELLGPRIGRAAPRKPFEWR